ncbi:hypothetical protein AGMMS49944_29660 [Spirochaetia bacterium]|nr:hypothetical protein AGMMS49944_29660 [Spirochaetia bacterium]
MILALIVIGLLLAAVRLAKAPVGKMAVVSGFDPQVLLKWLGVAEQVLGIIFPALISVFLYLHLDKDVIYIEGAEAIIGIVLSAAIAIVNIIITALGGDKK